MPFGTFMEPKVGQAREISRLLRAARLPFLVLLLLPAALPEAFPYANRFAPIYGPSGERLGWAKHLDLTSYIKADALSYNAWASYTVALVVWLLGILAGIYVIKVLNAIGSVLAASEGIGPATTPSIAADEAASRSNQPDRYISPEKRSSFYRNARVFGGFYALLAVPYVYDGASILGEVGSRGWIAGLATMIALAAVGVLYAYLGYKKSKLRLLGLLGLLLPASLLVGYDGITASVAICAALALMAISITAFVLFVKERYRIVVGAAIVAVLALLFGDDRARFEDMDYGTPDDLKGRISEKYIRMFDPAARSPHVDPHSPSPRSDGSAMARDEEALDRWKDFSQGRSGEAGPSAPPPKLAVVCVTGGASRSAYWSAEALDRLGKRIAGFDEAVRVISGASGGMIGTSYYVKFLKEKREEEERLGRAFTHPERQKDRDWVGEIPVNSLNQVARYISLRMGFSALANLVRPALGLPRYDRGIELERTWRGIYDLRFDDLYELEAAGRIPSLIFSPMTVEDGRRLLISNLDLTRLNSPDPHPREMVLNEGGQLDWRNDGSGDSLYSLSAVEYSKFYPAPWKLRLSTAARMSASFPWVSPAVNLPGSPPLRVVDAGYYDSYGVSVAVSWLYQNREWVQANTSGVVLVQLRDATSFDDRFGYPPEPSRLSPLAILGSGLQVVTSPADAALKARETSSMFRNDQEVALLAKLFERDCKKGFFTTVVLENAAISTTLDDPISASSAWPGDRLDILRAAEAGRPPRASGSALDNTSDAEAQAVSARDADAEVAAGVNVAMSWYLTAAEKGGLKKAIPENPDWAGPENLERRRARIDELRGFLDGMLDGKPIDPDVYKKYRPYALRQYARARNYERIEALAAWWGGDHSK
ncbi:patatin-like phospholipase family protein [Tundrisphaera lichenicola]|uniref:patatin-like phospholipase family protein n=1 Tax=Tundrisphaera lichenicola TaxID=2029860 RepID=UPI003EB83E8F